MCAVLVQIAWPDTRTTVQVASRPDDKMTGGLPAESGGRLSTARQGGRLAALLLAATTLVVAAAACAVEPARDDASVERETTLQGARSGFVQAAAALLDRDREGFMCGLPPAGSGPGAAALAELGGVFDALAPLPWRSFAFEISPVRAARGVYRVCGTGQLGDAGPPDRVAVVRDLRMAVGEDGVTLLADETPDDLRDRYLMALHDPVALRRPGIIVLGERRARGRAEAVLAAAEGARPRLERLGIDTRETVVVTVYGSAGSIREAVGVAAPATRLAFFSHPALRSAAEAWPVWDVGVMGPWFRDLATPLEDIMAHELAHAYTLSWFEGDEDPPALLVEGIAQAAEGVPSALALREEVATGNQLWPLPESFGDRDVWEGGDRAAVRLGYQVGASLIDYVLSHWGAGVLRSFVRAVAAAEPTQVAMDEALTECLGVDWGAFYEGWRRSVLAGD